MYTELRPNSFDVIRYTLEIRYKDLTEIANLITDWNYGAGEGITCFYQPHMSNKKLQEMFTKKLINPTYANDYQLGFGFSMDTTEDVIFDCTDWDDELCDVDTNPDTFFDYGCNNGISKWWYGTNNGCPS